jgi:hypothetical protein
MMVRGKGSMAPAQREAVAASPVTDLHALSCSPQAHPQATHAMFYNGMVPFYTTLHSDSWTLKNRVDHVEGSRWNTYQCKYSEVYLRRGRKHEHEPRSHSLVTPRSRQYLWSWRSHLAASSAIEITFGYRYFSWYR